MKSINQKTVRRIMFMLFLTVLLSASMSLTTLAAVSLNNIATDNGGKFEKANNGKWMYQMSDGSYAKKCLLNIKGKTYLFSTSGYRKYGFQTISKKKFYFGSSSEGYMYKSKLLKSDKGNYYYLKKDGVIATGWNTVDGNKYYFRKNGKAYTGRHKIGGVYYNFGSDGILLSSGAKLKVNSDCALLIEAESGKVLFDRNGSMKHANASTTKIMTCILALEKCKLTDKVTASANAAAQEPTKLYMKTGESFELKDLLYSLMIPSHNDTAVAIAEHISGTTAKFAELMNTKAKAIGCTNTHFVTPNGLDRGYDHYTTAKDLAKITQYALKNETFCKIVKTGSYSFKSKQGNSYSVVTTNALLNTLNGMLGVKTGYTDKARYCFVGAIKAKNGKTYISVVLGGKTSTERWSDSQTLLKYAYNLKN